MKKIKAKNFRYLDKEDVKDPIGYINFFYTQHDFDQWREKVYVFITSGFRKDSFPMHDPVFANRELKKHVEIAYLLLIKNNVEGLSRRFIEYLFHLKTKESWLDDLDDLLKNAVDFLSSDECIGSNPIRTLEIFYYLIECFYLMSQGKETDFQLPIYVLSYSSLTDEEKEGKNYHLRLGTSEKKDYRVPLKFEHRRKLVVPQYYFEKFSSVDSVKELFDANNLRGWKKDILYWHHSIVTEGVYWSSSDKKGFLAANLLYNYSCLYGLIEMYSLLISKESSESVYIRSIKDIKPIFVEHKGEIIDFQFLTPKEFEDPLISIIDCVSRYTIEEWQIILYDWLYFGLCFHTGIMGDTFTIYQSLMKIVELTYILSYKNEMIILPAKQTKP